MSLEVLFEDFHFIALNKPAGLPTQAPVGIDSLEARVKAYIKEKYQKPAGVYLGIPHRLDKPVSGVVVFARNSKAAAKIAAQFEHRTVRKTYWALVEGTPHPISGIWQDFLRKIPDVARAELVSAELPGAKEAVTEYRVLRTTPDFSWMELLPQTGRMHQLRIQAASRGFPILGDTQYGSAKPFDAGNSWRIALHARSLVFDHPFRKVPVRLEAEIDSQWPISQEWIKELSPVSHQTD